MDYFPNHNGENSVWERYGFCHNPFDTRALSPMARSPLPIAEAFVERTPEDRSTILISNILAAPGGERLVVEGEIGVGKTTFVNYHRYIWQASKHRALFTTGREISMYPEWNVKDFLLNILANLVNRLLLEYGEEFVKENKVFQEILLLSRVFSEKNTHIQGSVNVGLVGIGGGYATQRTLLLPNISESQLFIYFQEMVQEIVKLGYRGVLLHLDNLEITSRQRPEETKGFFENIRDILQITDVYFIFVGQKGFFYRIISPLERVRSIFFGCPIFIEPLTLPRVFEVFERRYKLLAQKENRFLRVVADDLVEYLYRTYNGKIRFIMDAINSLVYQLAPHEIKTFSLKEGREYLRFITAEKIKPLLTPKEWEVLHQCILHQRFQNMDISKQCKLPHQNISRFLKRFLELNLIYPEDGEQNKIVYRIAEELLILSSPSSCAVDTVSPSSPEPGELSQRQQSAIALLKQQGQITIKQHMELYQISRSTAQRDLNELEKKGLVARRGFTRNAHYILV